ncbi:MAG: chemotaxis protein CheW [Planctomycetota bacterium]
MQNTGRIAARLGAENKFLTFRLAQEIYGAETLAVREIVALPPITPVPNAPAAIRGVFNLRGKIIPVLDLPRKFGMQTAPASAETCLIVFEIRHEGKPLLIATWVDSVCDVVTIAPEDISAAPDFGMRVDTTFLRGIARTGESVILLLRIAKVLTQDEQAAAAAAAETPGDIATGPGRASNPVSAPAPSAASSPTPQPIPGPAAGDIGGSDREAGA